MAGNFPDHSFRHGRVREAIEGLAQAGGVQEIRDPDARMNAIARDYAMQPQGKPSVNGLPMNKRRASVLDGEGASCAVPNRENGGNDGSVVGNTYLAVAQDGTILSYVGYRGEISAVGREVVPYDSVLCRVWCIRSRPVSSGGSFSSHKTECWRAVLAWVYEARPTRRAAISSLKIPLPRLAYACASSSVARLKVFRQK